ncbi:MAG: ATP-binding cassette domain-containing protein [Flavobacteriales bacterium]|nr:ATP-binding cassette domain-containing protein [Flavobacteriales bacterium]
MVELGLGYLTLDRAVTTLSGGERQRATLAGQLSSNLFGVIYVLDEPTIGLDPEQVAVLSKTLKKICANGNTVVVVEHDPAFIQTADYLIEMGPAAGRLGGEVIYQGKIADIGKAKHSITYQLLNSGKDAPGKSKNKKGNPFGIKGASANNLKRIDIVFYAEQITAVTGVSGSGKSSLIKDVLYRSWQKKRPVNCDLVSGLDPFEEVLLIDQELLSQNRLSTPVSYSGILDQLKTLFSKTAFAKDAGLKRADFSYQSKNGKCPICNGYGQVKTSMDFMSDIWLTCDACSGMRYNDAVLACTYKGRSIGGVLQMTVQEAIAFFGSEPLVDALEILKQVGVGHLLLGQAGNTLSAGEAQRLKLAASLMQKRKGKTLYLFDEPSTGLHYFDILQLIAVFQSIVERGDTLLFIEHNATLIESADRVIALGPGSGERGGEVVRG